MISRLIENQILNALKPGKVIGLFGARQTGKTVLMEKIKTRISGSVLLVHGENLDAQEILSSQRTSLLKRFSQGYEYLFIDEAQEIPHIGVNLKLLVDTLPSLGIFVTGSSAFNLKTKIGEPLVGRSRYFHLYPLSILELQKQQDYLTLKDDLESILIWGQYPQVVTEPDIKERKLILEGIRDGYLLKDILELDNLKNSLFIFNLLRLLAFQIGKDISYSELAQNLNSNKKTVMRYLDLLDKSFVLFALPGFSRNLRKEYTRSPRYFFWDNGVRNSVISNYNSISVRDDIGMLWENFCITERIKANEYQNRSPNRYYWRTYDQKEIDYIEESDGKLSAFEFKWVKNKIKTPQEFLNTYHHSRFQLVNKGNYLDFVAPSA